MTNLRSKFRKIKDKALGHRPKEQHPAPAAGATQIEQPPSYAVVAAEDEATGSSNSAERLSSVESAELNNQETLVAEGEGSSKSNAPSWEATSDKSIDADDGKGAGDASDWRPGLWEAAFDLLKQRNEKLVDKYMACIGLDDGQPADPDNVARAIQALMDKRDSKKWRISISGNKSFEVRDSVEVLLHFLKLSSRIITDAVQSQPYVALAWAAVGVILPIVQAGSAKNAAMMKGLVTVSRLQLYWKACEDTDLAPAYQPLYKHLRKPLLEFYSCILEYHAHVVCHLHRRQLGRGWEDAVGLRDWDELSGAVTAAESTARGFLQIGERDETRKNRNMRYEQLTHSGKLLENSYQVQKDILDFLQDSRLDDKLQQLCKHLRDSTSKYIQDKAFNEPRVDRTCEWFFENKGFLSWRDRDESALFWLSAGPGCGKSVLSKTLVDEGFLNVARISADERSITTSSTTVAYFFFKTTDASRTLAQHALSAILLQLVEQLKSRQDVIKKVVDKFIHQSKLGGSFEDIWRLLIDCVNSPGLGDVICVLDALDECDEKSCEELIGALQQLFASEKNYRTASNLKFFITGRPELNITNKFKTFASYTSFVELDGAAVSDKIAADIEKVIDFRVNKFDDLRPFERELLAKKLKAMENRTYLWLHLTLESIAQKKELFLSPETFDEALNHLPSTVSDAYEALLANIPKEYELMSSHLFRILLMAFRPLTISEAQDALNFAISGKPFSHYYNGNSKRLRGDFPTLVKKLCGLLIQIHDSTVVFIHLTAKEFLLNEPVNPLATEWKGRFSKETNTQVPFTRLCVSYLLLPGHPSLSIPLSEITDVPFLRYASLFWPLHYQGLSKVGAKALNAEVREMCRIGSPGFKTWRSKISTTAYSGKGNTLYRDLLGDRSMTEPNEDNMGWIASTDLYMATACCFPEIVRFILEVEKSDLDDWPPLETALDVTCDRKDYETAIILIEHGADISRFMQETHREAALFLNEVVQLCNDEKIAKLVQQHGVKIDPEILQQSRQYRSNRINDLRNAFEQRDYSSVDICQEFFKNDLEDTLAKLEQLLDPEDQSVSFDQAAVHFAKAYAIIHCDEFISAIKAENKGYAVRLLFARASTMSTPQTFVKLLALCSSDKEICKYVYSTLVRTNKTENLDILLHEHARSANDVFGTLDEVLSLFTLEAATLKILMDGLFQDFDERMLIERIENAALRSDAIANLWNIVKSHITPTHAIVEAAIQNDRFAILRDILKAQPSHLHLDLSTLKSRVMEATIAGTVTPTETILGLLHIDDTFQFTQELFDALIYWEKNFHKSFSRLLGSAIFRFPDRFTADISDDDLLILANREDVDRYLNGFYKHGLLASRSTWPALRAHFEPFPHKESRRVSKPGESLFLRWWLRGKPATAVVDILDYIIPDKRYSGSYYTNSILIDIFEHTDDCCVFSSNMVYDIVNRLLPALRAVTRPRTFRSLLAKTTDRIELSDLQIRGILFNDSSGGEYFAEFFYHAEQLRGLQDTLSTPFTNVSKDTITEYFKSEKATYTSLLLLLRELTVRDYISEGFMAANLDLMSDVALSAIHREMPERLSKNQILRERMERKLEQSNDNVGLFSMENGIGALLELTTGESVLLNVTKNTTVNRGFQRGYKLLMELVQMPDVKVNELDEEKHSALWVAIAREQYEWVKVLSVVGADWYIEDEDGVTPWDKLCEMADRGGEKSYWGSRRDRVKRLVDDPYRPISPPPDNAPQCESQPESRDSEQDYEDDSSKSIVRDQDVPPMATAEGSCSFRRLQQKQLEQYLLRDCAP